MIPLLGLHYVVQVQDIVEIHLIIVAMVAKLDLVRLLYLLCARLHHAVPIPLGLLCVVRLQDTAAQLQIIVVMAAKLGLALALLCLLLFLLCAPLPLARMIQILGHPCVAQFLDIAVLHQIIVVRDAKQDHVLQIPLQLHRLLLLYALIPLAPMTLILALHFVVRVQDTAAQHQTTAVMDVKQDLALTTLLLLHPHYVQILHALMTITVTLYVVQALGIVETQLLIAVSVAKLVLV